MNKRIPFIYVGIQSRRTKYYLLIIHKWDLLILEENLFDEQHISIRKTIKILLIIQYNDTSIF